MAEQSAEQKEKKELQKKFLEKINDRQTTGELMIPKEYALENALRAAYFIIGETKDKNEKLAIDVCTPDSISEALFKMAVQGLDPSKLQCYFIVNGTKLSLRRSYQGAVVVAKRVANVIKVPARTVHEGDTFDQEIVDGEIVKVTHTQDPANLDKPILFAYAIAKFEDGSKYYDVMTFKQLKASWSMSQNPGEKNKLQNMFSVDAAQRTIINRCCKTVINQSTDANLYEKDFTDENEVEETSHEVVGSKPNSDAQQIGTKRVSALPPAQDRPTIPIGDKPTTEPVQVTQQQTAPAEKQKATPTPPPAAPSASEDASKW